MSSSRTANLQALTVNDDPKSEVQSAYEALLQTIEDLTHAKIAFLEADLQKKISETKREYKILFGRNPLVHDMEIEKACREMKKCIKKEDAAIEANHEAVSVYSKAALELTKNPE